MGRAARALHLAQPTVSTQLRELAPITLLSRAPNVLVVGPALQIKSVQDLVQAARANPGKLTFGSSGNMGSPHLAGELFKLMAGVDMTHVPFKGAAAAQVDLMAGRISLSFASLPSTLPHMKSGRVRGIAVTTEKRFSLLPELPTVSESGLAGFETSAWQGFTLPAATPRAIVAQLHAASIAVLNQPSMRERLTQDGAEVVGSSPDEFWVFVKAQISKWTKVVKAAGLSPE